MTAENEVQGDVPAPVAAPSDRVLDLPNALCVLRCSGAAVPLAAPHRADGPAVVVLMVSGVTDYLDGKLARR